MILVQKRQKFVQTTRFWRQIFQNFAQKAPNFKPKNAKQNYILLHFYVTLKPRFHEKRGFFCKIKFNKMSLVLKIGSNKTFLPITYQMCVSNYHDNSNNLNSCLVLKKIVKILENMAKNTRFFFKIARKISKI